ncbi:MULTISPECIES: Vga family ABC-F type ribosomal protection protein [unclassified Sporosarcina]|uniref:Vga family ABC-F type ribosomal protection protein n=1 Tax=unclassified Sporosarcina TaxID=2647733 RepID=UPI000C168E65|nr:MULTISPECIES: Vga family ABC-F type ribosomal protection protein [unclassified Sporosarcina]PID06414.1 ABC transporter [Sporosarcina sp. P30]PID09608.1 ABC transporter [Sporosarcina sp. P31]PID13185.1 ABC transporter [Sporosarcina sp. P32b]
MIIVEANHIKHYIQDRLLLDIDQLEVHAKDRIGLVGRNGSGKTTLLNILTKKVVLEGGQVIQRASVELLPQLKRTDTAKSGGEITQEYIQQALASDAALLLADEPTTNLDTEHIEWVEKKLNNWPGALILISHDRIFLDSLCTTIWEIDEGRVAEYKGNYTQYSKQKEVEFQQKQQAFEKYQKQKHHLEEAIKQKEEQAQRATKKPKNLTGSEARIKGVKPYFANKQKKLRKTVSAFETRLENLETIEKQKDLSPIQMNLPNEETFKNQVVLRAEKVHGMVGERVLWNDASFYIRGGDKVAVMGSNGTGKTTLIKKIIEKEKNITVSPSVKIGYFTQNLSILDLDKTILENVQSTSTQDETLIRTVLAIMHFFTDDVYKSVNVLSGGERVKVALTKIFLSDVNMLVLDEPTNYLDLESLEALESLLKQYKGIIIFVSHDRKFIENVSTRIIDIQNKELIVFDGRYEQYKSRNPIKEYDLRQNELLLLETKISEVISRLSVNPTKELEMEFQRLLDEKRELQG